MTSVHLLASGHGVAEAPFADQKGAVYFSDITKGGVYYVLPGDDTEHVFLPRRKGVGGLAPHRDGGLVLAGRDICHVRDGETRQIVGPHDFPPRDGVATSFNDFGVAPSGELYVGTVRSRSDGSREGGELARVATAHQAEVLLDEVLGPNGVVTLPDASEVLQVDSHRRRVAAVNLAGPAAGAARFFGTEAVPGVPDGLALDEAGNLWIAFYGGGCIAQWSLSGTLLERIALPATLVTSLCFDPRAPQDVIVTTADNAEDPALEGCVFRLSLGVSGFTCPEVTV